MARPRKKPGLTAKEETNEVFQNVVAEVARKLESKDMLTGTGGPIHVLRVPSIAVRYLLQNEGFPLSCITQIVGPEASFKSTTAIEFGRWHVESGGYIVLNEAETKPTPELRQSVLGWRDDIIRVEDCTSLEDWQRKTIWYTEALQKRFRNGPGKVAPICTIVDSLLGKASEDTLKKLYTKGHAERHWSIEAAYISDFMRAYPQKMLGWPFSFIGVNHMKLRFDPKTGLPDPHVPGGWSLKFQCAVIIAMTKVRVRETKTEVITTVSMRTLKNTYGRDNLRIQVDLRMWYEQDETGDWRLHTLYDWHGAAIKMLLCDGMTKATAAMLEPKIREVVDIHEKAGGQRGKLYWSDRLGVPSVDAMPISELGAKIEADAELLVELYRVLGIQRRPLYVPGKDYDEQLSAAREVEEEKNRNIAQKARIDAIAKKALD